AVILNAFDTHHTCVTNRASGHNCRCRVSLTAVRAENIPPFTTHPQFRHNTPNSRSAIWPPDLHRSPFFPMSKSAHIAVGSVVAIGGALSVAPIALHRGEEINAMWLVVAAVCSYAIGYRFYSKFIAARVLALDAMRATPAERLENGRDYVRTNK